VEPVGPVGAVDVLIVAYGSADTIGQQVKSLAGEDEVAAVIVVDHGTDGSAELAREAGAIAVHDPTNPGFGSGMNRAARLATAEHLLLMNPDAELGPEALAAGLDALSSHPDAAAAQGLIRTPSTGQLERAGGRELGPIDLLGRAVSAKALLQLPLVASVVRRIPALSHQVVRGTDATREVDTLAATALLVRRAAFEAVGGFDERIFLYAEDLDLCRRLRAAGWRLLYLPVPWADHENGSSSSTSWMRELRWWEGTMAFAARWWSDRALRLARAAAWIRFARLAVRSPRRAPMAFRAMLSTPGRIRRDERHHA
jgi:GT2 family glycosyltransferase